MMLTGAEIRAAAGHLGLSGKVLLDQLHAWHAKEPWFERTVRAAASESGYNETSLEEIIDRVKREQVAADERFNPYELQKAGGRLGYSQAVTETLNQVLGNPPVRTLLQMADTVQQRSRMEAVIEEARRLRQPADDDTITIGELRAWLDRELNPARPVKTMLITGMTIDKIVRDIRDHREPEYPEGTVVTDGRGIQWKRRGEGWSRHNWSRDIFPLSEPRRPLKVIPQ